MEEPQQPVVGAVERAADKRCDVRRSDKPVPRDLADDLNVIIGEAKGRRFRRTAEPRQPNWSLNGGNIHTRQLYQPPRLAAGAGTVHSHNQLWPIGAGRKETGPSMSDADSGERQGGSYRRRR